MGHIAYRRKALDVYFPMIKVCTNRNSDGRVMTPRSRGVGVVFACFSGEDSSQTGEDTGEPRVARRTGVFIFPMHLGPRVNLQWVGKTLRAKAIVREKNTSNLRLIFPCFLSVFARVFDLAPEVGFRRSWYRRKACATLSLKILDLRETELGFARYGFTNRDRRSVFGPLEDIFPIEILAKPGKILTIREFHTVHACVLFSTYPSLQINSLWVRKTLPTSMVTSREKFWNFQHSLISSAYFRARGRRSSRYWISAILVSSESLCYLLSKGTGLAQRRTWVREIWSREQRSLECSLCQGVVFWLRFRLDRRSSWRSGSCTS